MEKQIFKVGDRVFVYPCGWGNVTKINVNGHPMIYNAYFDRGDELEVRQYQMSFTEYQLNGLSQERPINYEDYIGCWGLFWNKRSNVDKHGYVLKRLMSFNKSYFKTFNGIAWHNFEPLNEEQLKAFNLENPTK